MTLSLGLFLIGMLGLSCLSSNIFKQQDQALAQQYVQTTKSRNLVPRSNAGYMPVMVVAFLSLIFVEHVTYGVYLIVESAMRKYRYLANSILWSTEPIEITCQRCGLSIA